MINFIEMGATLFIPATHKDLKSVINGVKYQNLRSVLVDTEDSIDDKDIQIALSCIQEMLSSFTKSKIFVFIRPRNVEILKEILSYKHIDKIDGFILPKFTLDNADEYLKVMGSSKHHIMPSIEGRELFESSKLVELRDKLLPDKDKIILIRFGLEDMLRQLRMRRTCEESIFDRSVTSAILGNFIAIFKASGFEISGGVYPCFKDEEGFKQDVLRDLKEGLFSKTIIHPSQIEITNQLYKVSQNEFDEARAISGSEKKISVQNSKMLEKDTMNPYAQYILSRAQAYGVR